MFRFYFREKRWQVMGEGTDGLVHYRFRLKRGFKTREEAEEHVPEPIMTAYGPEYYYVCRQLIGRR